VRSIFSSQIAFHTPQALGFYLPPLMFWAALALPPFLALRWSLRRGGFYGFVWHPTLFDTALYVIVLGAVLLVMPAFGGGEG